MLKPGDIAIIAGKFAQPAMAIIISPKIIGEKEGVRSRGEYAVKLCGRNSIDMSSIVYRLISDQYVKGMPFLAEDILRENKLAFSDLVNGARQELTVLGLYFKFQGDKSRAFANSGDRNCDQPLDLQKKLFEFFQTAIPLNTRDKYSF